MTEHPYEYVIENYGPKGWTIVSRSNTNYKSGRLNHNSWTKTVRRSKPKGGKVSTVNGVVVIETDGEARLRAMTGLYRGWEKWTGQPKLWPSFKYPNTSRTFSWAWNQCPWIVKWPSTEHPRNEAIVKLRLGIRDAKVSLLVDVAEIAQTASMFEDIASQISEMVGAVYQLQRLAKSKNYKERQAAIKQLKRIGSNMFDSVPSNWLMSRYGIGPLMGSIQGLKDILADTDTDQNHLWRKVETNVTHHEADIKAAPQSDNMRHLGYSFRAYRKAKATAWIRANATPMSPLLKRAQQLGLTNIFSTAHDLIPFSFVGDWIVNIGDVLGGLDATLDLAETRAWIKVREYMSQSFISELLYENFVNSREIHSVIPYAKIAYQPSMNGNRVLDVTSFITNVMQGSRDAKRKFPPVHNKPPFTGWDPNAP